MNLKPVLAPDKVSAAAFIVQQKWRVVELDYASGAEDLLELARVGRQHGVAVLYRAQEAILVESLRALRRGLEAEKSTWRSRHLLCQFELSTIPSNDVKQLWARAETLGDVIVPADAIEGLYTSWKH